MSVKYSVVMRKNPSKASLPGKYYAHAQAYGEMDFDSLCEEVNGRCTVTRADVAGVVEAVLDSMKKGLSEGRIVRLGNFGSFQIGVRSNGAETADEFASTMIHGTHITFRPGKLLINMQKTLAYAQVPKLPVKVTNGGNEVG
jgi:DNA-binding protein, histone-like, putative